MFSELISYLLALLVTFSPTPAGYYKVIKVVDGDTIKIAAPHVIETVRMIGVDTPETVDPRRPVQCFGKEASNFTKKVLTNQNVKLESDVLSGDRDKYKRLLRYVILENGQNFNQMLIAEGFGHEYTYKSTPYKYQLEFKQAERDAREGEKGLWAPNVCAKMNQ